MRLGFSVGSDLVLTLILARQEVGAKFLPGCAL